MPYNGKRVCYSQLLFMISLIKIHAFMGLKYGVAIRGNYVERVSLYL
jgi:hypothetical protein